MAREGLNMYMVGLPHSVMATIEPYPQEAFYDNNRRVSGEWSVTADVCLLTNCIVRATGQREGFLRY